MALKHRSLCLVAIFFGSGIEGGATIVIRHFIGQQFKRIVEVLQGGYFKASSPAGFLFRTSHQGTCRRAWCDSIARNKDKIVTSLLTKVCPGNAPKPERAKGRSVPACENRIGGSLDAAKCGISSLDESMPQEKGWWLRFSPE